MFKIIIGILSLAAALQFHVIAAENACTKSNMSASGIKPMPIPCASQLQPCFNKILQLPELRQLIVAIQQEGNIRIIVNNGHFLSKQFGAFWDPCYRTITVNEGEHRSEGSLIGSIIFELHNASVNKKLHHFDRLAETGQIDCETYVQGVERIEYENSLNASRLTHKGIQQGLFPKSAFLPTYATFEKHYQVQQQGGHSAYIAQNYYSITSSVYHYSPYSVKTPSKPSGRWMKS